MNAYAAIRESLAERRRFYSAMMLEAVSEEKREYYASLRNEMDLKIFSLDRSFKS